MKRLWILALVVLPFLVSSCNYNALVNKEEDVTNKWANVESQYQRRADLIPNLVNTVKGAADFEKSTLTEVTEARANATSMKIDASELSPEAIQQYQARQGELSQALGRLLAVSENYPQLQATQSFRDLQAQLEGTENRINIARNDFNAAVTTYNKAIRKFPTLIYAGWFGFEKKGLFQADAGAEKAPSVDFGNNQ